MNIDTDDDELDPEERVSQIRALFGRVRTRLNDMIDALEAENAAQAKDVTQQLNQLQTVHVALVKAEEAFHEKSRAAEDDTPDYP